MTQKEIFKLFYNWVQFCFTYSIDKMVGLLDYIDNLKREEDLRKENLMFLLKKQYILERKKDEGFESLIIECEKYNFDKRWWEEYSKLGFNF